MKYTIRIDEVEVDHNDKYRTNKIYEQTVSIEDGPYIFKNGGEPATNVLERDTTDDYIKKIIKTVNNI